MKYYEHNGILYTLNAPIINDEFVEITQDEYESKLSKIKVEYIPPSTEDGDDWTSVDITTEQATEQDYQEALAEMGVVFDE